MKKILILLCTLTLCITTIIGGATIEANGESGNNTFEVERASKDIVAKPAEFLRSEVINNIVLAKHTTQDDIYPILMKENNYEDWDAAGLIDLYTIISNGVEVKPTEDVKNLYSWVIDNVYGGTLVWNAEFRTSVNFRNLIRNYPVDLPFSDHPYMSWVETGDPYKVRRDIPIGKAPIGGSMEFEADWRMVDDYRHFSFKISPSEEGNFTGKDKIYRMTGRGGIDKDFDHPIPRQNVGLKIGNTMSDENRVIPAYKINDGWRIKDITNSKGESFTEEEILEYKISESEDITINLEKIPVKIGQLVVKFVDQDGKEIAETIVTDKKYGENYETEKIDIEGYEYVSVEGDEKGIIENDITTVTYKYAKKAKLVVKYEDFEGNTLAEEKVTDTLYGESYETSKIDITGYEFIEVEGDEKGTIKADVTTVIYKYAKKAQLVVNYVDQDGNPIADPIVSDKKYGDNYETTQLDIEGYEFVSVEGDTKGIIKNDPTIVTYKYAKKAQLIVNYVDQDDKPIADSITTNKKYGDSYETTQLDIEGYEFVSVEGDTNIV